MSRPPNVSFSGRGVPSSPIPPLAFNAARFALAFGPAMQLTNSTNYESVTLLIADLTTPALLTFAITGIQNSYDWYLPGIAHTQTVLYPSIFQRLYSDLISVIPVQYPVPREICLFYGNPGDPVKNNKINIKVINIYSTDGRVQL